MHSGAARVWVGTCCTSTLCGYEVEADVEWAGIPRGWGNPIFIHLTPLKLYIQLHTWPNWAYSPCWLTVFLFAIVAVWIRPCCAHKLHRRFHMHDFTFIPMWWHVGINSIREHSVNTPTPWRHWILCTPTIRFDDNSSYVSGCAFLPFVHIFAPPFGLFNFNERSLIM